ncbi:hypothetical protein [Paenibacillus sp. V4I5]|uniref:hypothetical protein n=1 Tax=Paenibacillus sp. V4I5 TaxID=3042306 RepID=UPI0027925C96|nr:hypothetical protein [Paenibacillus sp. V4I5]MDQ0917052.1 hypothetical protein [Paenibacillus sp. V4I5]
MDFEELKQRVGWGEEFQFYYKDQSYWISRNVQGFYLTRVSDSCTQSFSTAEDLFEFGKIEGNSIAEIWPETL